MLQAQFTPFRCGRIGHVDHDDLLSSQLSPQSLEEFDDNDIERMIVFFEEVVRSVPNYAVQLFFFDHITDERYGCVEHGESPTDHLEKVEVSGVQVHSGHYLGWVVCTSKGIYVFLVEVVLVLEYRLSAFADFEGIPAGTDVVQFVSIFNGVLEAFFVPWSEEDQLIDSGKVFLLSIDGSIFQHLGRIMFFELNVFLESKRMGNGNNQQYLYYYQKRFHILY